MKGESHPSKLHQMAPQPLTRIRRDCRWDRDTCHGGRRKVHLSGIARGAETTDYLHTVTYRRYAASDLLAVVKAILEAIQRFKSSFVELRNNRDRIDLQQQLWSRQRHHLHHRAGWEI